MTLPMPRFMRAELSFNRHKTDYPTVEEYIRIMLNYTTTKNITPRALQSIGRLNYKTVSFTLSTCSATFYCGLKSHAIGLVRRSNSPTYDDCTMDSTIDHCIANL